LEIWKNKSCDDVVVDERTEQEARTKEASRSVRRTKAAASEHKQKRKKKNNKQKGSECNSVLVLEKLEDIELAVA